MAETPRSITVNVLPAAPPPTKVSAKVWASTLATLAASLLLALVTALITNPNGLGELPPWLAFLLAAILPTLAAFLGGYAKRDQTRELGAAVQENLQPSRYEPAEPTTDDFYRQGSTAETNTTNPGGPSDAI